MRIGKIGVVIIGLVPFNVYGECTPTPDCASIGYTETSCEGDYLACPFDSTKLKCTPCDSSFRYDCSGENITGGTGSACGGKYVACECSEGTVFNNGNCLCDTSCSVGNIYYSDRTCSSCVVSEKNPIGVVVKDNKLIVASSLHRGEWGAMIDVAGLEATEIEENAKNDYNGTSNTLAIVSEFGTSSPISSAGVYCYTYYPQEAEWTKNKWYLAAAGEVYDYIYLNYDKITDSWDKLSGTFYRTRFWTSTEYHQNGAWVFDISNKTLSGCAKRLIGDIGRNAVPCFLAID